MYRIALSAVLQWLTLESVWERSNWTRSDYRARAKQDCCCFGGVWNSTQLRELRIPCANLFGETTYELNLVSFGWLRGRTDRRSGDINDGMVLLFWFQVMLE